jgi:hypothetical protein
MAKNSFGLLIVGVIVTLFASPQHQQRLAQSATAKQPQPKTAEEFIEHAHGCVGELACQESLANVQQAFKLNPNLAMACVTCGSLQLRRSQFKAVQPALQDYRMARSLYQEQNKSEAVQAIDRVIEQVDQGNFVTCLPSNPEVIGNCI